MNKSVKTLSEIVPILLFFLVYKVSDLMVATTVLVLSTLLAASLVYYLDKVIPKMLLISTVFVALFGSMTVFSGNETFIKVKPTIVNVIFAAILLFGVYKKQGYLKHVFGGAFKMPDEAWLTLSVRWAVFFLFLAFANELVWRNMSTDLWVQFKVFGILGMSFIFIFGNMPFMLANVIEEKSDKN